MSSGFPSFSHFFSQDDVSEQHEAEGALSDGEETHQRLLGHLDKFKHRVGSKRYFEALDLSLCFNNDSLRTRSRDPVEQVE